MRAFSLGALAGVWLALTETIFLAATVWGYFTTPLELGGFALASAALLGGTGAILGGVIGAVVRAAERFSHARRPLFYAALSLPWAIWLSLAAFAGPQAHALPARGGLELLVVVVWIIGARTLARRLQEPASRWIAVALGVTVVGLYLVNQWVLPRLYGFFHLSLAALSFLFAVLWFAEVGVRPLRRPWGALVLIACMPVALWQFRSQPGLRSIAIERTVVVAPILSGIARLWPASPVPAAASAPPTVAPLAAHGPKLRDEVDIFVITVDALRADAFTADNAPNMVRLAEGGVRFARAYAAVPHTSYSIASLLTGKYVFSLSTLGFDPARHQTWAQVMGRERFKTAAFFPPSVFFIEREKLAPLERNSYGFEYVKYEFLDAEKRTDQVIAYLEQERPARTFSWIHYLEPHEPYDAHPGITVGTTSRQRYEGEIRYVDREVGRLVEYLRQHRPHALVVLSADHGEEFRDHGGYYHGTTLYEEQVRVPLAMTTLDGELPAGKVETAASLVDVAPTVMKLLGIEPSAKMQGRDLGPWMVVATAPAVSAPVFAEIDRKKMIVLGHDKLICDFAADACQLFDLVADPREQRNLVGEVARYQLLRSGLDQWILEQSKFERTKEAEQDGVLDRARHGDHAVLPELFRLAEAKATQKEAIALIGQMELDAQSREPLEALARTVHDRWLDIALGKLGDAQARTRVRRFIEDSCAHDPTECAHAALALDEVRWLGRASTAATLSEPLHKALIAALGESADGAAFEPLANKLSDVRLRADVVRALGVLGDYRTLDLMMKQAADDPYVNVRLEMARVIARLGRGDREARATLERLRDKDADPSVRQLAGKLLSATHAK